MAASVTLPGTEATVLRFPKAGPTGLWNALAASTSQRSAAGSRLAEPTRLGQPVSLVEEVAEVVDMFAFRSPDPAPAA